MVFFRARLVDSGGGSDEFGFATDNQHTAGERFYTFRAGRLDMDNVRVHRGNGAGTDRVLAALRESRMCGDLNTPR